MVRLGESWEGVDPWYRYDRNDGPTILACAVGEAPPIMARQPATGDLRRCRSDVALLAPSWGGSAECWGSGRLRHREELWELMPKKEAAFSLLQSIVSRPLLRDGEFSKNRTCTRQLLPHFHRSGHSCGLRTDGTIECWARQLVARSMSRMADSKTTLKATTSPSCRMLASRQAVDMAADCRGRTHLLLGDNSHGQLEGTR